MEENWKEVAAVMGRRKKQSTRVSQWEERKGLKQKKGKGKGMRENMKGSNRWQLKERGK